MEKRIYKKYVEKKGLKYVDWKEMKRLLKEDHFDNGRSDEQLQLSFENSHVSIIAYDEKKIIGTARALSDGVCNAYIVDVWTLTPYRKQGVASKMMKMLLEELQGQHIYLFTDNSSEFYKRLGFKSQPEGLGQVVGQWLQKSVE